VKRTGHVPFMQLRIGIFVLIACLLLLWATFQSGSFRLGKEETIQVQFERIGGLEEGAIVRLNGVPVGVVRKISLVPGTNDVAVKLGVKTGTRERLHQGAYAHITTVGFLAELYVELTDGLANAPKIHSDSEIRTDMMADPAAIMNKANTMADSMQILVGSLTSAGRNFAQGQGTLGRLNRDERLYEHMVALTNEATLLTERINQNQARVTDRLVMLTGSLDSLTWQLQHGNGTAAQLLRKGELYDQLASSTARLDSILNLVQSGHGTFGRMMADTTLYEDTKALMGSMKRLMAEIEKDPKKYFKFSLF
jgi:phospholipid/cholesterol/gamma-HCH transport system substrate-binding protein